MSVVQIGGVDHAFVSNPVEVTAVNQTDLLPLVQSVFPLTGGTLSLTNSGDTRGALLPLVLKAGVLPLVPIQPVINYNSGIIRGSKYRNLAFVTLGPSGSGSNSTPPPTTGVVYPVYR